MSLQLVWYLHFLGCHQRSLPYRSLLSWVSSLHLAIHC
uniref:Uncharacterized protein n=1 Tax=Arundo donax TaxID=35708 RepID=A0A0A9Q8X5_ARUDO